MRSWSVLSLALLGTLCVVAAAGAHRHSDPSARTATTEAMQGAHGGNSARSWGNTARSGRSEGIAEDRFAAVATVVASPDVVLSHAHVSGRGTKQSQRWPDSSSGSGSAADVRGLRVGHGEAATSSGGRAKSSTPSARASAQSVDLMNGLVKARRVIRSVRVSRGRPSYSGTVLGLEIEGRAIGNVEGERSYELPGGGRVTVNHGGTGLSVRLGRAVGEFPAGFVVNVASVELNIGARSGGHHHGETEGSESVQETDTGTQGSGSGATADPRKLQPRPIRPKGPLPKRTPPTVHSRLTSHGFAFPVHGTASIANDFGGPRHINGRAVGHQGNDIFAPFGAPVVAVADGIVYKVGTLAVSGNRLWLRSDAGDEFFYAHLSAFSPQVAAAGISGHSVRVRAGTVVGFVGNTGDAITTPPHLHFEIHPGGGDAIDPYPILTAWNSRHDVAPTAWMAGNGKTAAASTPGVLVTIRDPIAS